MHLFDSIFVRAQNVWFTARDEESGQTLVEYALIISLIAVAAVGALGLLSGKINGIFDEIGSSL